MNKNLKTNSSLSNYRIVSKIGKGGMCEVYLAKDTKLDRQVALKILPAEFAEDIDRMTRFVREAKSASALNHPNIITIYEINEFEGTHFIATEYIEGETLQPHLANNNLSLKELLDIAIQIASALQIAHSANIIHRDIKPDNVMIRQDGLAKILDFGIAKLSEASPANVSSEDATAIKPQTATTPGTIIGTANYMSPEQAKGKAVDARSDIFSFGVVLYEMLAGKLPFEGETAMEMIGAILKDEPKPIDADVPNEISEIINKCLLKDRNKRYQTIKDVLNDLQDTKQDLELQNLIERTISPEKEEPKTQILQGTTVDEANQTTTNQTIQGKPTKKYIAAALAVLLISVVGFFGYNYYQSTQPINSIAVLPFENNGSDADTEYLSDGLAESLIFRLSQLPNLKVSPSSSVFRYKGKATDAVTVGNELGVNAVLTGRIIQRGDDLNISVELIDVRKDKLIWGEKYQRKLSELLTTQRQIATEISQNLKLKLSGNEKGLTKPYTSSNEAYQLFLKGNFYYSKRTAKNMLRGIDFFKQAVVIDPDFALAYAKIAEAYGIMTGYGYLSPNEVISPAKAAAKRALEIDPGLSEAHTVMGYLLATYDWDWENAEREFKRGIELDPNKSDAHLRYGQNLLIPLGRSDESIAELKRAAEIEPLSVNAKANLSRAYFFDGQYDKALEQAQKVQELEPRHPLTYWVLGRSYIAKEKYEEAITLGERALEADPTNQSVLRFTGIAYAKAGRRKEAEAIIKKFEEIAKTEYVVSFRVAQIYSALGEKDKAFAELEKAYAEHDWELPLINVDPVMDPLRNDPRFKDLLKHMGLPE